MSKLKPPFEQTTLLTKDSQISHLSTFFFKTSCVSFILRFGGFAVFFSHDLPFEIPFHSVLFCVWSEHISHTGKQSCPRRQEKEKYRNVLILMTHSDIIRTNFALFFFFFSITSCNLSGTLLNVRVTANREDY